VGAEVGGMSRVRASDIQQLRPSRRDGLLLVAGLVLGIVLAVVVQRLNPGPASAHTVDGWAFPSSDGNQIGFSHGPTGDGIGYDITGVAWAGPDGVWHRDEGGATCVGTDPSKRTKVALDLVTVRAAAGTISRVEALRCRQ
jgi:hypothetical protein